MSKSFSLQISKCPPLPDWLSYANWDLESLTSTPLHLSWSGSSTCAWEHYCNNKRSSCSAQPSAVWKREQFITAKAIGAQGEFYSFANNMTKKLARFYFSPYLGNKPLNSITAAVSHSEDLGSEYSSASLNQQWALQKAATAEPDFQLIHVLRLFFLCLMTEFVVK